MAERLERHLAAIMFTDIVDSSAVMGASEAAGIRVRHRHFEVVRPIVERYHGRLIEEAGDETLSSFPSAVDAVSCALAIHAELRGDPELRIRAGIHLGEVVFEGRRVHGDGVNVAARIRALAEPGGTTVSGEVYTAVRNQGNVEATSLGDQDLKNIDRPVTVYSITGEPTAPGATPALRVPRLSPRRLGAIGVAALVVVALGWWAVERGAFHPGPIRSIAVLPLANLSGDEEQRYFVDGLTDALIGTLAKIESLRVISRTSVMSHRDTQKTLPEVARELEADAIIEGSVLRAGNRVRITTQLIDARTDQPLWSQSYERDLSDILALQGELAEAIAREIELELTPRDRERLSRARPVNPIAYDATLKGRQLIDSLTPSDHRLAVRYFERAIAADPEYAPAYCGLAEVYT